MPTTLKETHLRLRRVITALQAEPTRFWDPGFDEWCVENRVDSASSPNGYKRAYLHGEVWRNDYTLKELYAFFALRPWDRLEPPRKTIARVVYRHVRFLNRDPEQMIEEDDYDFSF